MGKRVLTAALAALLGLSVACGEEEPATEEPATEEPAAETAEAETAEAEVDEPTADEVPIPEDFEEEAVAQITPQNYESELDALAAEIEADTD